MKKPLRIYGAWLYAGKWDGTSVPPQEDWTLLNMKPGQFQEPPTGFSPLQGQVTLLMQGDSTLIVEPE